MVEMVGLEPFAGALQGLGSEGGGLLPGCLGLCYSALTHPVAIPARHFPLFGTLMGNGHSSLLDSLLVAMPMCLQTSPPEQ